MSQKQWDTILKACKPVLQIALQCGPTSTPQQNANAAWEVLGKEMDFKHTTVRACDHSYGEKFFTAEEN